MATATTTPFSVTGKTAIVTGAGSGECRLLHMHRGQTTRTSIANTTGPGINLSFAALLLSRDCNVVLADLALRPEAQELVDRHSGAEQPGKRPRAVFVETDVTSWPALSRMFDVAVAEFGAVDVVCPGAGVYEPHWSSFWHPPGSAQSRDAAADGAEPGRYALLDINLTHPIRATQLALEHWLHPEPDPATPAAAAATMHRASPSNPKRVVHIGSVAGQMPNFCAPLYAASKFGVHGLVRSLAPLEASHGVRVSAVAPGVVCTPLWVEHPDKMAYLDPEADGWVTPDEVAAAMLRCVEDEGLPGGTVLEVGKGRTRTVAVLNDPGPPMDPREGLIARNGREGWNEIFGWLKDRSIWGRK